MDAQEVRLLDFLLSLLLPLLFPFFRLAGGVRRQGRARSGDAARPAHPQRRHRHQRGRRARLLLGSSTLRQTKDGAGARRREDGAGRAVVKTEPGLAGGVKEELDDAAALKWARDDWSRTELERQRLAYEQFEARRRGRDEGGVVVLDDSDDDAPPPPVRHGEAGQGSSRGGRAIKKEKVGDDDEDGGDIGDFAALSDFFAP